MATIHYLNVRQGDCSVIEHNSGRVTIIDVCNAEPPDVIAEAARVVLAETERGISGNFQQKKYPVNPIYYLAGHAISSVFRYIQTHPDMDHMDGIKAFFEEFSPINFWDTDNKKELMNSSWKGSPYHQNDWEFYKRLRDTNPETDPLRLTLFSENMGQYWNRGKEGKRGGDGLQILAPTRDLVEAANDVDEDYNRCSYVLLYRTGNHKIVFGGDSHDETWDHILAKHKERVTDVDLLIAPHHGRKSGRSYKFLDTLNPTLTFFGNARSEDLAYSAWRSRGLSFVTNNQANCMVVDADTDPMTLYVTHEHFARRINNRTSYSDRMKAWYVGGITKDLVP